MECKIRLVESGLFLSHEGQALVFSVGVARMLQESFHEVVELILVQG